jgi:hypothetical protein
MDKRRYVGCSWDEAALRGISARQPMLAVGHHLIFHFDLIQRPAVSIRIQ